MGSPERAAASINMPSPTRLPQRVVDAVHAGMIIGVRAGLAPHRFLGVWAVVVRGRVFVRSWNDKPTGWHRAFLAEPRGAIEVAGRRINVRARRVRGAVLIRAIERAYAEKYHTPASRKWVRGFKTARRRATTTEFLPR